MDGVCFFNLQQTFLTRYKINYILKTNIFSKLKIINKSVNNWLT